MYLSYLCQLRESSMSSYTEELWYNETVSVADNICCFSCILTFDSAKHAIPKTAEVAYSIGVGELGWRYGTGLKSHGTVTNWCTGRGWPVNSMTDISARWWSKHAIPKTVEVDIPLAIYGKRLSGRWTLI